MSRDTGIRNLIPGYRDPDEIKEDQNTRRYVETIVNQRAPVRNVEPFGTTLVRTTPSLNLGLKPRDVTEEPKSFISKKEFENHLINSPTKQDQEKAYSMVRSLLKVPEAEKNKMADEWMRSGGRDPKGRSLDEEIKLGKEEWLKKQKEEAVMLPAGLGNKYKSDIRTPVERKRAEFKAKAKDNKAWTEANKPNADTSKGGYVPWFQRLADEAREKEEEDPRTEGRMEALQKIEDEGKSWFSKHLKKSQ